MLHFPPLQRSIIAWCSMALLLLSSCTSDLSLNRGDHYGLFPGMRYAGHYKVGKPYRTSVDNLWYHPKEDPHYDKIGVASWYGPRFHKKRTANGDTFDKRALTAAHNTLPMPSMVRVTNLENGRAVVLMINDRGPFAKKREIDVSERAAELLAFKQQGYTKVRVEFLKKETDLLLDELGLKRYDGALATRRIANNSPFVQHIEEQEQERHLAPPVMLAANEVREPRSSSNPAPKSHILSTPPKKAQATLVADAHYIQLGAFKNRANAEKMASSFEHLGAVRIQPARIMGATLYHVQMGPFLKRAAAERLLKRVVAAGNEKAMLVASN